MMPCGLDPDEVGGGESRVLLGPQSMPDCQPLAIVIQQINGNRVCVSRWTLSEDERRAVAAGADVLLYTWGWQVPVALSIIADGGEPS